MNMKVISGLAIASFLALAACEETTGTGTGGGGGITTSNGGGGATGGGGSGTGGNPGGITCSDAISGDPTMAAFDLTLTADAFLNTASYDAYAAFLQCACVDKSGDATPGCADTCDGMLNGTGTNNFCNGAKALMQCNSCLSDAARCSGVLTDCLSN